jgi:hypothetical protein
VTKHLIKDGTPPRYPAANCTLAALKLALGGPRTHAPQAAPRQDFIDGRQVLCVKREAEEREVVLWRMTKAS